MGMRNAVFHTTIHSFSSFNMDNVVFSTGQIAPSETGLADPVGPVNPGCARDAFPTSGCNIRCESLLLLDIRHSGDF